MTVVSDERYRKALAMLRNAEANYAEVCVMLKRAECEHERAWQHVRKLERLIYEQSKVEGLL